METSFACRLIVTTTTEKRDLTELAAAVVSQGTFTVQVQLPDAAADQRLQELLRSGHLQVQLTRDAPEFQPVADWLDEGHIGYEEIQARLVPAHPRSLGGRPYYFLGSRSRELKLRVFCRQCHVETQLDQRRSRGLSWGRCNCPGRRQRDHRRFVFLQAELRQLAQRGLTDAELASTDLGAPRVSRTLMEELLQKL